jgi:hypothetical protein
VQVVRLLLLGRLVQVVRLGLGVGKPVVLVLRSLLILLERLVRVRIALLGLVLLVLLVPVMAQLWSYLSEG